MFIKKFYDAGVAETGGSTETATMPAQSEVKETIAPKESVAAMMAKHGVKTTGDSSAQQRPVVNKETKEEAKPVEKSEKVATTTTTSKAETANSESQPPTETKVAAETKPIAQSAQTEKPWQEVLKGQQPDKVLKELGYDDKTVQFFQKLSKFEKKDFFVNLFNEWEKKGDLKGYFKEINTDYGKMTPEEVMRHQLSEDYGTEDPKTLDALFKNKIIKAYNLDSDDPDEVEEGKLLLNAEANKYRPTLIARQQTKLFPEVPPAAEPESDQSQQKAEKEVQAWVDKVSNDPYSQKVWDNKKIVIGKGDNKFSLPIVPEEIKNIMFTNDGWTSTMYNVEKNPDGSVKSATPKVEEQILIAAFAQNPKKFLDDYAQHYLSIGGEKAIAPIQNAKPPEAVNMPNGAQITYTDPAAAMAKKGVKVAGGV